MKKLSKTLFALLGAIMLLGASVQANTITLKYISTTPGGGGTFDWNYTVTFANSMLDTSGNTTGIHDFFTINDFGLANSFTFTGALAPMFTFSQASIGPNVPGLLATLPYTDQAALNATFVWDGANNTVVPDGSYTLTLNSNFGLSAIGAYNSSDHSQSPFDMESHAVGFLNVPTAPDGGSAVALLGMALSGIEILRRKLRAS